MILEPLKLGRWIFQLMTIIFNISNIIITLDPVIKETIVAKSCVEHKLIIWLTEVFYTLLDKQVFRDIETSFESKLDISLIRTKIMIIRTIFYTINLIIGINDVVPNAIVSLFRIS